MMFPRLALFAAALSVASVSADLTITNPTASSWWVAGSVNTLTWTCQTADSTQQQFTVLIGNTNPQVQAQPQAIIAQENNFDCSKLLTADQVNQAAGTGWFVQLADVFNSTHVYAQSDPFEIKPFGSAYPTSASPPAASATSSGSGSTPSPTAGGQNEKSGATGLKATFGGALTAAAAVIGFVLA